MLSSQNSIPSLLESCYIARGQHRQGSWERRAALTIHAKDDALIGLGDARAVGILSAVDGGIFRPQHHELVSQEDDGHGRVGCLAGRCDRLPFRGRQVEACALCPDVAIEANDGGFVHLAGSNKLIIDVRLPRHCRRTEYSRGSGRAEEG